MNDSPKQTDHVYADTSVFGGVFDDEFGQASEAFFRRIEDGRFRLVISPLIEDELEPAPRRVVALFERFRKDARVIDVTVEAMDLHRAYLDAGIVTARSMTDALHVALATVSECRMIVSWNFRHIVHFEKVPRYTEVSVRCGYRPVGIYSPLEVIEHDDENDQDL